MIKLFGIEAEINFTADEHVVKSLGKHLSKAKDLVEQINPDWLQVLKNVINKEVK